LAEYYKREIFKWINPVRGRRQQIREKGTALIISCHFKLAEHLNK
jgi:hypothetical protein